MAHLDGARHRLTDERARLTVEGRGMVQRVEYGTEYGPIHRMGTAYMASIILSGELLERMTIQTLERRCQEETLRYYRREPTDDRYGYHLFRRAIVGRDEAAWEALERIYRGQLMRWARCHHLYGRAGEEAEALANQALESLWRRVEPTNFDAFPNLTSILGYLQRCVFNLVIDQARMRVREQHRAQVLGNALTGRAEPTPQGRALDRATAAEIWKIVRAHCRDQREERLAYAYLVLALKPSDILAMYPGLYDSTATINAVLATMLKRLRRSPVLRHWAHDVLAGERVRRTRQRPAS